MPLYRKKPVVVEAMLWDGTNMGEVNEWIAQHEDPDTVGDRNNRDPVKTHLWVAANQAWVPIDPPHWIILDASGFYPCLPDRFEETYEAVTDEGEM